MKKELLTIVLLFLSIVLYSEVEKTDLWDGQIRAQVDKSYKCMTTQSGSVVLIPETEPSNLSIEMSLLNAMPGATDTPPISEILIEEAMKKDTDMKISKTKSS